MITIYHNPRCSKSRECNVFLKESLTALINLLEITPIELVRTNEAIWKSEFKGKNMSSDDIVNAMVAYPKLIQRPIVVRDEKAVIARPLERVQSIL